MALTFKRVILSGAEALVPIDQIVGGGNDLDNRYSQTITLASWGSPSSGVYSITVLEATHGREENPVVQVYENDLTNFDQIEVDININPSGDITISVPETPDLRFEGKIIIE